LVREQYGEAALLARVTIEAAREACVRQDFTPTLG
jgi:hypothetical protein